MRAGKLICLLTACILAGCFLAPMEGMAEEKTFAVPVSYRMGDTFLSYRVDFSDAVFSSDPTVYHHSLARMSLGMALSAYRDWKDPSGRRQIHAEEYLEAAGFSRLKSEQFDVTPSRDTIATIIGSKKLGTYTLVAVAVSGGNYQMEWLSNFEVGQEGAKITAHKGFTEAAQKVKARITAYLAETEGPYILWLAGYSRAAAVSNMTAALLLQEGTAQRDHLFAYTFAAPANSRAGGEQDALYDGIWNIVGAFDPVPQVPLAEWGFTRFGHTLSLTCPEADRDFPALRDAANAWTEKNLGRDWFTNPYINYSLTKILERIYAVFPQPEDYVRLAQARAQQIMQSNKDPIAMAGDGFALLEELSGKADKSGLTALVTEQAWNSIRQWAGEDTMELNDRRSLTENLMREHYPESYVGLLMGCGEEIYDFPHAYWRVAVAGDTVLEAVGLQDSVMAELERLSEEELIAWEENGGFLDAMDSLSVTGRGGESGFPVVRFSEGAVAALPVDGFYVLSLGGPAGSTVQTAIQRYSVGQVNVDSYISDPLPILDADDVWTCALSDDEPIIFFPSQEGVRSEAAVEVRHGVLADSTMDLLFLGHKANLSLRTVAAVVTVLLILFFSSLIIAVRSAWRGRRFRASAMLLVLVGVFFVLTALAQNFLPARRGLRTVFKGMTTIACLLECLLCASENHSRRNYLLFIGFIFYLANDLVITKNFLIGILLSTAGSLLFCAAFFPQEKADVKRIALWLALTLAGAALIFFLRTRVRYPWLMLLYAAVQLAMVLMAWDQGKQMRAGAILFVVSNLALLYNEVGMASWWSQIVSMGLYYSAIGTMAVGAKGTGPLQRERPGADESPLPLRNSTFFITAGWMLICFSALQIYLSRAGTVIPAVRAVLKALIGTGPVLLCMTPAWRFRRSWMAWLAAGMFFCLSGDVEINYAALPGIIFFAAGHICFTLSFRAQRRMDKKRWIIFAALWAAASAALIPIAAQMKTLPGLTVPLVLYAGVLLLMGMYGLGQDRLTMAGAWAFILSDLLLGARIALHVEKGWLPALALGMYYLSLMLLCASCRRKARALM